LDSDSITASLGFHFAMTPKRSSKGRGSLSKSSLRSPAVEASATTPGSNGKKKMTKEEKEQAKARARLVMTGQCAGPVKTSKQSTKKQAKSEELKSSSDNDSKRTRSDGSESSGSNPPKQYITNKEDGATKERSAETRRFVVNDASVLFRSVTLDDAIIPEYQPVPKLLMKMQQTDEPTEVLHLLNELLQELNSITGAQPNFRGMPFLAFAADKKMHSETTSYVLLSVAQKWKVNEEVQVGCLRCLKYLTGKARSSIVAFGGVETIVNTMHRFLRSSQKVLELGCACLCHLFGDGLAPNTIVNIEPIWHRFIHEMDGISLLLKVMTQCKHSSRIQVKCITLFGNLATYPENRGSLDKACVVVAAASAEHHAETGIMDARKRFMKIMFGQ
jgi:hypothetical protein